MRISSNTVKREYERFCNKHYAGNTHAAREILQHSRGLVEVFNQSGMKIVKNYQGHITYSPLRFDDFAKQTH